MEKGIHLLSCSTPGVEHASKNRNQFVLQTMGPGVGPINDPKICPMKMESLVCVSRSSKKKQLQREKLTKKARLSCFKVG